MNVVWYSSALSFEQYHHHQAEHNPVFLAGAAEFCQFVDLEASAEKRFFFCQAHYRYAIGAGNQVSGVEKIAG